MPAQGGTGLHAPPGDARRNPAPHQGTTTARKVIPLVSIEFGRTSSGPTSPSVPHAGNSIDRGLQLLRIVDVGAGQADGQGEALSINQQMELAPGLPPVRGIGSSVCAAAWCRDADGVERRAGPVQAPCCCAWSSRMRHRRIHTPPRCHSSNRRSQVRPLPNPSARGSWRHGRPQRRRYRMPARVRRSECRGRPPLGRAGGAGNTG